MTSSVANSNLSISLFSLFDLRFKNKEDLHNKRSMKILRGIRKDISAEYYEYLNNDIEYNSKAFKTELKEFVHKVYMNYVIMLNNKLKKHPSEYMLIKRIRM